MIVLALLILPALCLDLYGFDATGYLEQVERERGRVVALGEALGILSL